MIVAGLGFTTKASAEEIIAAVNNACETYGHQPAELAALATIEQKRSSSALISAAKELDLPIKYVGRESRDDEGVDRVGSADSVDTLTHSDLSIANTGHSSVSEFSAISVVAGWVDRAEPGGCASKDSTTLLGPRIKLGPVTCALAASS